MQTEVSQAGAGRAACGRGPAGEERWCGAEERGHRTRHLRAQMFSAAWLQTSYYSASLCICSRVRNDGAKAGYWEDWQECLAQGLPYKGTLNTHSFTRTCYCLDARYAVSCGIYTRLCFRGTGV